MTKPSDQDIAHMLDIVNWLGGAVQTGAVTGLSIVLVDESDPIPVPRHVFFATPGATSTLAGGYVLAQYDLARALAAPVQQRPPTVGAADQPPVAGQPHQPTEPVATAQPNGATGQPLLDEVAKVAPEAVNELLRQGASGLDAPSAFTFEEMPTNEEPPQKH